MRPPLMEAEQDGSICIEDLTKIVMARSRLGLAEQRLVPFEAVWNVAYADDRPCAFHRISAVGLTRIELAAPCPDRCKPARNSLRSCNLGLQPVHQGVKATQRLDGQMQLLHLRSQTA